MNLFWINSLFWITAFYDLGQTYNGKKIMCQGQHKNNPTPMNVKRKEKKHVTHSVIFNLQSLCSHRD